jgi:hypothetical protein
MVLIYGLKQVIEINQRVAWRGILDIRLVKTYLTFCHPGSKTHIVSDRITAITWLSGS